MNKLEDFILADTQDVFEYFAKEFGGIVSDKVEEYGESSYYFREGAEPWILIAHVDSWQSDTVNLVQHKGILKNASGVLGADDRAGVYSIYRLLKEVNINPSILLTNGEEIGGWGVDQFISDYKNSDLFEKTKLFVELDMYGNNYCAQYGCEQFVEQKFRDFYLGYGWIKSFGGFTDVARLSQNTNIPNMNFSVCYVNQHTKDENLDLVALEENIERFKDMFINGLPKLLHFER
jgi:hypothetical protein